MSLMRFLSSGGRGLTKGAEPMGRYRLPDGHLIPEFGKKTNPFHSKSLPPQGDSRPAEAVPAKAAQTQAALPSSSLSSKVPTGSRSQGALLSKTGAVARRLLGVIRRMPRAIAARVPSRKSPFPVASSTPSMPRGAMQGELSLDAVRVVRNDLSDSDFEVICAETRTGSPVSPQPQVVRLTDEARPLGRLAERLFGAKKH